MMIAVLICPAAFYDTLIVEGWCLGAMALSAEQLALPVNALDLKTDAATWRDYQNQQLQQWYQPLWPLFQSMLYLQAPDWTTICRWRQQQEDVLWRLRATGMDAATLQQFMLPFQRVDRSHAARADLVRSSAASTE
ncbi:MAG: hypothetical protein U5L02_10535 [Rheinheimera sp.]|nr:hypothetical protein [Rheinheimera sp.]